MKLWLTVRARREDAQQTLRRLRAKPGLQRLPELFSAKIVIWRAHDANIAITKVGASTPTADGVASAMQTTRPWADERAWQKTKTDPPGISTKFEYDCRHSKYGLQKARVPDCHQSSIEGRVHGRLLCSDTGIKSPVAPPRSWRREI
jgi:hypothetical protein